MVRDIQGHFSIGSGTMMAAQEYFTICLLAIGMVVAAPILLPAGLEDGSLVIISSEAEPFLAPKSRFW